MDYTNYLENADDINADFIFCNRTGSYPTTCQSGNSNGNWSMDANSTPSSGTGPTAPPTGRSAYIYTETSSPYASDVWVMERDQVFDTRSQNFFLDIIHNLYIYPSGYYYVEYSTVENPNRTTDWNILETVQGTNINSWIPVTYDFSGINVQFFRVRIRCDFPADWHYDLAFSTWREYSVSAGTQEQEGFRFRDDDGSESTATWRVAQDVDDSIGKNTTIRIRLLIDTDNSMLNGQYTLQYKRSDEPSDDWRTI